MYIFYHYLKAILANIIYGFPSRRLKIIGVTGTKGKTTTANFIWAVLNHNGHKCGLISTANIRVGEREKLNYYHMTMPGPFIIQQQLRRMVMAKCEYGVIEATSEGLKLNRHWGIKFDTAIFTNLSPEHLPSHQNNFDVYRRAKGKLFQNRPNLILVNADDPYHSYYLHFPAVEKATFSFKNKSDYKAKIVNSSTFELNQEKYSIKILGAFNLNNALPAVIIGLRLGIKPKDIQKGLQKLVSVPGRMELIPNSLGLKIIVDYAHEPVSLKELLTTAQQLKTSQGKIILIVGAEGGGRDPGKRAPMGKLANQMADYVVITNVDPYRDNPQTIADDIAKMVDKKKRLVILDREKAIKKALESAQKGDVILITGKGAEQSITIGGQKYPWDDRKVVKRLLNVV
ncbi:MAG TPA: UDP-N-acetylmuramoyl-L-alanyl-D-glutamate--2,6-diaminopimelate ligase [Candidatus Woesebacteria bacterium]|nr:UDP-N-acetylmuramoyl-L-alanyl-D-glutamate--2,6-diaminopimelate ligase [Candidatus Woesebacteria bacterium]